MGMPWASLEWGKEGTGALKVQLDLGESTTGKGIPGCEDPSRQIPEVQVDKARSKEGLFTSVFRPSPQSLKFPFGGAIPLSSTWGESGSPPRALPFQVCQSKH